MGWLHILLGMIAAVVFWINDYIVLTIVSVVITAVSFWTWGVMHNFATEEAQKRSNYSGDFYDITPTEANSVPNWTATVSLLTALATLALFIISLAIWLI